MRPIRVLFLLIVSLLVLLGFLVHCRVDHGLAPLPGRVEARVIFRNTPPENTQGIYLTVSPVFPPHAINEMYHSPNSLPVDRDTVWAEMALPFGHYDAIALWWYGNETETNFADILGLPLDAQNNLLPQDFTLSEDRPVFSIDLYVNWDRVRYDASVSGTIRFSGPFPENTQATAVAAYQYRPEQDVHYLLWLKAMDFSLGPTSPGYDPQNHTYEYTLPLRHGRVEYIAVFWLPEGAGLTDYRVLGAYPATLSVAEGQAVTGIDIDADWSAVLKEMP